MYVRKYIMARKCGNAEMRWQLNLRTRELSRSEGNSSGFTDVPSVWGPELEDDQAWHCAAYLRRTATIVLQHRQLTIADVSRHTTLLNAEFPERGVRLDGGTDLLVVPGHRVEPE